MQEGQATARDVLLNYWAKYADKPTVQSMMLNDHAELVDASDRADVMMGLPDDLAKMRVLEIGAGIGRFTQLLAEKCRHVTATDFIASFIEKNQELHGHYPNVSFEVGDAVKMEQSDESQDLIFTNWLLMYLTDEEMYKFFMNVLRCLQPEGYMTLRESCTESSTKAKSKGTGSGNPTHYRHVSVYITACSSLRYADSRGGVWTLEPQWSRSIETYVQVKENWRQCQILFKKVPVAADPAGYPAATTTLQECLVTIQDVNEKQELWDRHMATQSNRPPIEAEREVAEIMAQNALDLEGQYVLNLVPSWYNPFVIAREANHYVTALTADPNEYSALLDVANNQLDQRVRVHWLNASVGHTKIPEHFFDWVFLSSEQRDGPEYASIERSLKSTTFLYVVSEDGSVSVESAVQGRNKAKTIDILDGDMSYDDDVTPPGEWEEE